MSILSATFFYIPLFYLFVEEFEVAFLIFKKTLVRFFGMTPPVSSVASNEGRLVSEDVFIFIIVLQAVMNCPFSGGIHH